MRQKRDCEERGLETEKGSLVPLVLTTSSGMERACEDMLKRLAHKNAEKRGERYSYSNVINHLGTRLRFSLLREVLIALTGERGIPFSKYGKTREEHDMYFVNFNLVPGQSKLQTNLDRCKNEYLPQIMTWFHV